ncbi:uncharacterized protein [Typha latifolia]|uniref:uncharacterized protein n=1 Tax=Typha latifolia TaxID=4733 RepID=UPI003C2E9CDF
MAASKEIITYGSLSKIDKQRNYDKDFLSESLGQLQRNFFSPEPKSSGQDPYQLSEEPEFVDDFDSAKEYCMSMPSRTRPEVNVKNVLGGLVAILSRWSRSDGVRPSQGTSSSISFLGSASNGDNFLHPSVYIPSAPPLLEAEAINYSGYRSLLEADPPEWVPDSYANVCMQCSVPFTLMCGRHHCRFCGGIFCGACTKGKSLLPVKFRERNPQRVCDSCYDRLDPLQGILINSISNATQSAKHDVMDWTCTRGWLNLPVGLSMEHEIYKAANTLKSYSQVARLDPERSIPQAVLKGAKGLAILTVAKAGTILTYKMGTGLVVARRSDGSWSAPSAIISIGLGWGAQIGAELMDFIIVLHGSKAVKTFSSQMHFSFGAGLSAAAGPVGRVIEADLRAGDKGSGMCYTYSCSKGAFLGVSLEGNIIATRQDANLRFYGDPYVTTSDILLGTVGRPNAAAPLYSALDDLYSKLQC